MGKILIIKGADFSQVAIDKVDPVGPLIITISDSGGVTIVCEGATAIYYTTNGSTPTTGSTKYTAAFNVTSGTTVKAIAEFASGSISSVVSKTYSGGSTDITQQIQLSVLPLGKSVLYDTSFIDITKGPKIITSLTRIGLMTLDMSSILSGKSRVTFTLKEGFEIALFTAAEDKNVIFYSAAGNPGSSYFVWTTNVNVINVDATKAKYIGFNIRYSNNTTQFTDNILSKYITITAE